MKCLELCLEYWWPFQEPMSNLGFIDISHTYTLWWVFVHVLVTACSTKVLKLDNDLSLNYLEYQLEIFGPLKVGAERGIFS